jgi:D-3-phosphoglycerate dehydrogenase
MIGNKNVLITDYVHPVLIEGLEGMGFQVTYAPEISRDDCLLVVDVFSGIVINTKVRADRELLHKASSLKFVARLGSGLDIIDLEIAHKKNISVINSPEGNRNAVGEHAFGMLLSLLNHIPGADKEIRNEVWLREKNRGKELSEMVVGIIGFGNTGTAFARKFAGWQTKVLSYDKYKTQYASDLRFVEECSLDRLLTNADVVSLHVPLTDETLGMVDDLFISNCKQGAILINTSRGKVVRTRDLVKALVSGKLGGACLDVLENEDSGSYTYEERVLYNELFKLENTILTPHVAGWTIESKRKIAEVLLDKIKKLLLDE